MGMYTGLRGKIQLKKEFVDKIKLLLNREVEWEEILPEECSSFYNDSRASFIPFGVICYLDWDEVYADITDSGEFTFACSLKNYDNTIQKFLENVIPVIAENYYLEEQYEEDWKPTVHKKNLEEK